MATHSIAVAETMGHTETVSRQGAWKRDLTENFGFREIASMGDQVLGGSGGEFNCLTYERLAVLAATGGKVKNVGSVAAGINVDGGTVALVDPAGPAGRIIDAAEEIDLPVTCRRFTFRSTGAITQLRYTRQ